MLTKNDIEQIKVLLKDVAKQKDLEIVKNDLSSVKTDVISIKKNLSDLTDFVMRSVPSILEWTNDIHTTIVKENLPKRVAKLEQILKTS